MVKKCVGFFTFQYPVYAQEVKGNKSFLTSCEKLKRIRTILLWLAPGRFIFYKQRCHKIVLLLNLLQVKLMQVLLQSGQALFQSGTGITKFGLFYKAEQIILQSWADITNLGHNYKVRQLVYSLIFTTIQFRFTCGGKKLY